jgi:hypothetical protein
MEGNLDVQYTIGLAAGVPVTFIAGTLTGTFGKDLDFGLDLLVRIAVHWPSSHVH